jgi:two-component system, LytTR family, sensor histidine kinase AlgZ
MPSRSPPDAENSRFSPNSTFAMKVPELRAAFAVPVDWCSGPVMLRVILAFNALALVAVVVSSPSFAAAATQFLLVAAFLEPGLLLWLALACAGKRWVARLQVPLQYVLLALYAAFSTTLMWWLARDLLFGNTQLVPFEQLLLAVVAAALGITYLMRLRQMAAVPRTQQAHLADLEQRMRPHFLFNSLNAVSALIHIDATKAEAAIDDLAALYRTLTRQPSGLCSLQDELDLAKRYLGIESLRFGERLQVEWLIAPELLRAQVPTLCVQPLVENAVKHGVEASTEPIKIVVQATKSVGRLKLKISNTLPRERSVNDKGSGIALGNLRERLTLVYDIAADFKAESTATEFVVTLLLPL